MRAHEVVDEIQLGAFQKLQAHWVHQHGGTLARHHHIVRRLLGGKVELILQPGAAAGQHLHPQRLGAGLAGHDFRHALGGRRRNRETHAPYIASPKLGGKARMG